MMELRRGLSGFLRFNSLLHRQLRVCSSFSPRAVIFDMFGVLISSPLRTATEWEDKNGVPRGTLGRAINAGGSNSSWRKYMRGELGAEEFMEAFSQDCSHVAGFKVHTNSFHSALTGGYMSKPVPVMMDAVQCARAEGFKTAVLSNNFLLSGGKSFLPLDLSLFDVIVESCRVGLCKPDPRIYQLCADRLGVSPQEAVFLDDLGFNVEAAVQLGMRGIKVKDPGLAVKELEQVLKIPLSPKRFNGQFPMDQLAQYLKKATQLPLTDYIKMQQLSYPTDSTYLLNCGQHGFVLNKKPSTEALQRECRILKVLEKAKVPVPYVIDQNEAPSNFLGFLFYLTFYTPGRVFNDYTIPGEDPNEKRCVYEAMIKTLCQIHRVDLKSTGLENLKDSDDFMESQVKKWAHQFKVNKTSIPAVDRLIDWLLLHLPKDQRTTLVHGNFSLNHLVFDFKTPDVVAVLGWSLSTVGDPLVDLASCCMPHFLPASASIQTRETFTPMGIPSAEEIFDLYCKEMGLEHIPNWRFYMAFCFFRRAAILQKNHKMSFKGLTNPREIEDTVQVAWDFATKEGFRIFNALPGAVSI